MNRRIIAQSEESSRQNHIQFDQNLDLRSICFDIQNRIIVRQKATGRIVSRHSGEERQGMNSRTNPHQHIFNSPSLSKGPRLCSNSTSFAFAMS